MTNYRTNYFESDKVTIPFVKVLYIHKYGFDQTESEKYIRIFFSDYLNIDLDKTEMESFLKEYQLWIERMHEIEIEKDFNLSRIAQSLSKD